MTEMLQTIAPVLTTLVGALIAYVTTMGSARRQHTQALDLRKLELQAEKEARAAEEESASRRREEDLALARKTARAEQEGAALERKRAAVEAMLEANVRVERVATERWVSDVMEGPPASAIHDAVEDWERLRARALIAGVDERHLTDLVALTDDVVQLGLTLPGRGTASNEFAEKFRRDRWLAMYQALDL